MIQIGVLGARGRMGQWVCELLQREFTSTASLYRQAGQGDPLKPLLDADVVIDFSSPKAACDLIELALHTVESESIPAFVIGSTGWTSEELGSLQNLSKKTPVLVASNFAPGIFLLSDILKKFAPILETLGYTPIITEIHHKNKIDAPSGTAITLQKAIDPKNPARIETLSVRAGGVIGNHEICFYGPGDRIAFSHTAQDRSIFARGAIEVAHWLQTKKLALKPTQNNQKILGMEDYLNTFHSTQHP